MASYINYVWGQNDSLWAVAARFMQDAGYTDVATCASQIQSANPQITDWTTAPPSYLVTGGIPLPTPSGLTLTQPYTQAVITVGINPQFVVSQATPLTMSPSADNYVDLSAAGNYLVTPVHLGYSPPLTSANLLRLYRATAPSSAVTSVVAIAPIRPNAQTSITPLTMIAIPYATS